MQGTNRIELYHIHTHAVCTVGTPVLAQSCDKNGEPILVRMSFDVLYMMRSESYISHVELLLSNDSSAVKHVFPRASSNTKFILKERDRRWRREWVEGGSE